VIAVWMVYCVGIGLAFVVVGHALERGLHLAGRPTRWAWVLALLGAYILPVAAWLRPDAFATIALPIPPVSQAPSTSTAIGSTTIPPQPTSRRFSLIDLDPALRWVWGVASVTMLLGVATGAARLRLLRRRWGKVTVQGREVLVSPSLGPAVIGLWRPVVVLPEWALRLSERDRDLMLAHEEQHLQMRDPALLAAALVAVLVAPWNLALWWQWRRLRLAVEMDCDARVLRQGRSAPAYGELLLQVGRHRRSRVIGVTAFGEPVSFLESRIRRMVSTKPRWRWAGVATAVVAAVGAIVGACETPRPIGPEHESEEQASASSAGDQAAPVVRSWVEESARKWFPAILEPSGPPMQVFLIVDARLLVYRSSVTTLNYLGDAGPRPHSAIDVADLKRVLPAFNPERDTWVVVDPQALRGLVRDNVRIIWIRHEPEDGDPNRRRAESRATRHKRAEQVVQLARQYHPEVFGRPGSQTAVALVLDANRRVLAHAAKAGEARAADGRYLNGESCLDVLHRLIPAYKSAQWSVSGCAGVAGQPNVIVYWSTLK